MTTRTPATPDPLLADLRALRNMLGLTADLVANLAHVDKSSLSYWECGRHSPHLDKVRAVAAAIGFDLTLTPLDDRPDATEALTAWIHDANAARDQAAADRDRLVQVIGRLISLPPEMVAAAYEVGYTGQTTEVTA